MDRPFRHIKVETHGGASCICLRNKRMEETDILEMADEVISLIDSGCRQVVFNLGPDEVDCLYSVFLAKLVMIHRCLAEVDGLIKIAQASANTLEVFEACRLREYFDFVPDQATALRQFGVAGA